MDYWFTNPIVKSRFPLIGATGVRGLSWNFSTPKIFIGPNSIQEAPGGGPAVAAFGLVCQKKRAFVFTDEFGERFAKQVVRALQAGGFATEVWNKAKPEVPMKQVKEASEAMLKFEPDLVVAVGGGSVMDGAKVAWLLYEHPETPDLAMVLPVMPVNIRQKAHLAAFPTTSGTGSECTAVSVVHDEENHRKVPLSNPELMPDWAVLIPEFTATMPPKLTVGTGLDVLAHAIDSVPTSTSNEMTNALALAAIQMVFKYLPRVYKNGHDMEARLRMLMASSTAGIAFGQGGVALTHSFGHSLGSLFDVHHGLAVGMFIPYVFQFYSPVTTKYLIVCKGLDVMGDTNEESLAKLIAKIRAFFTELDVPLAIKDLGISKADFEKNMEKLVLYTLEDIDTFFSPRPMTPDQCERVFRCAYEGQDVDF